jgi:hypothetical protein
VSNLLLANGDAPVTCMRAVLGVSGNLSRIWPAPPPDHVQSDELWIWFLQLAACHWRPLALPRTGELYRIVLTLFSLI